MKYTNIKKKSEHYKPIEGVFFQMMTYPDGRRRFLRVSRGAKELLGYDEASFMEHSTLFYQHIFSEDQEVYVDKEIASQQSLEIFNFNFRYVLPEGRVVWLNVKSIPLRTDGGDYIWTGLFSDINDLKQQENYLVKINHELTVLNAINDVILSCNRSDVLLHEVCQTLVDKGGYRLAWMASLSSLNIPESKIEPIAAAGEVNYIKEISVLLNDAVQIKGPTISALKNHTTVITNNVQRSAAFLPWRDAAVKHGINSSIAIPFVINTETYVLNVYASHINAFDDHERGILERVCDNLTQAMEKLYEEQQKKEYYFLLQERLKELSVLAEVNDILRTESNVERALTRIAFAIPECMLVPDLVQVNFRYNNNLILRDVSNEFALLYEEHIELSFKGHLNLLVYIKTDSKKFDPLGNEKILVIKNLAKKIQLFIDNKQTLLQLEQSQSNLNSVFENTDIGYVLLNLGGDIISYNRQLYREMFKLRQVKIAVGMNLMDDVLKDQTSMFASHFINAKINHKNSFYEARYDYKGKSKFFAVSVFPILNQDKTCLRVCLTMKDITKVKSAEIESKRITNDLIVRNRDLEQFSFMISHNLRAPVVNLAGLTQQLKEGLPEDESRYVIDSILTSTSRIEGVINDINKILMIKKDVDNNKSKVDVVKLLDELQTYFIEVNTERAPEFHIDVKDLQGIESNKAYIESVFYNLISNAIKFAKPDLPAKIKIWTVRKKDKLMIHFKDDGIGIDLEKHQHNVFKLYNRFHNHIEGKGMGLYMTKTQIRLLGGDIEVISSPNKGTEFIITLPVEG